MLVAVADNIDFCSVFLHTERQWLLATVSQWQIFIFGWTISLR